MDNTVDCLWFHHICDCIRFTGTSLLQAYFVPRPSVITRIHAFYRKDQVAIESMAVYIVALRKVAWNCNFAGLINMLHDWIICDNHTLEDLIF